MPRDTTRRKLLGGLAATGTAALAGCTGATPFVGRRIEETETVDPADATAIEIVGRVGDLSIVGTDRDTVHLDVEKQTSSLRTDLEAFHLRSETVDDVLAFSSEYEADLGWFESQPRMNLDVELPAELAVERLRTSTGRIAVRDVLGDLEAESTTGGVRISNVDGAVAAEATTGSVRLEDVDGFVRAETTTGGIEARDVEGVEHLSTTTGSVDAALSTDLDAELVIATNTGGIDVDGLDIDEEVSTSDEVRGTLGEGGPRLRITTTTGSISVTALE